MNFGNRDSATIRKFHVIEAAGVKPISNWYALSIRSGAYIDSAGDKCVSNSGFWRLEMRHLDDRSNERIHAAIEPAQRKALRASSVMSELKLRPTKR